MTIHKLFGLLYFLSAQSINGDVNDHLCYNFRQNNRATQDELAVYPLIKMNQNLTIAFDADSFCVFRVEGYKNMDFQITVPDIWFPVDPDCALNYVEGDVTPDPIFLPKLQVCDSIPITTPITSHNNAFYMEIKTTYSVENENANSNKIFAYVTLNFKSIQKDECGPSEIILSKLEQMINFPAKNKTFTSQSECEIKVIGYYNQDFTVTSPMFKLPCNTGYLALSSKPTIFENPRDIICGTKPLANVITSESGRLYMKIITNNTGASFALHFKTIQGQECGPSVISLSEGIQIVEFPANNRTFTNHSECNIKVNGINGHDFQVNFPKMHFYCQLGYVAAASAQADLDETNYQFCGNNPILQGIKSKNGILYIKIVTNSTEPAFTLRFESNLSGSGSHIREAYALMVILICNILSEVLH